MAFSMKKRNKKYIALLVTLSILLIPYQTFASPAKPLDPQTLYSKSCALLDGDSGRVLFEKEGEMALANASTTKILTCILCLENAGGDEIVTATKNAVKQPKVRLGMKEKEQFLLNDLLYAMMLESFNDCAMALAEHVGGSVDEFAKQMNLKAKSIGCEDTFFITPNGLDAKTKDNFHHSTAIDLCKIMKYCCWDSPKSSLFLDITQTQYHEFKNMDGKAYAVTNKNAFLAMMDEAISGKTGFTSCAGYCYVAAIESNGRKYAIALLACGWPNHKTYKWKDAKALLNYGMAHYRKQEIDVPQDISPVTVYFGKKANASLPDWGKKVCVYTYVKNKTLKPLLLAEEDSFTYEIILPNQIFREVEKDDMLGKICFFINGELYHEEIIYAKTDCKQWNFMDFLRCMLASYFLLNN